MLNVETPYPNVGAKALLIEAHQAHPVRILQNGKGRGRKREILVSIVGREGSSATRRVTVGDLTDASPLTEAEEAEYRRLERKLAGKAKADRRDLAKFERLRLRSVHHGQLQFAQHKIARDRIWADRRARADLPEVVR